MNLYNFLFEVYNIYIESHWMNIEVDQFYKWNFTIQMGNQNPGIELCCGTPWKKDECHTTKCSIFNYS